MPHRINFNKQVLNTRDSKIKLNTWDYIHLILAQNAPSLNEKENKHLAVNLKDIGCVEHHMMYLNSVISCLVIYFILWIYQGEINHLGWIPVLICLIIIPLLPSCFYALQNKAKKLTYKKFALGQVILAPFLSYGWLSIGLKLAPESGVIQGISFGIVAAGIVCSIVWFKAVPIATFIVTVIYGVVISQVTSYLMNAQLSQFFTLFFLVGVNGIGLYLYMTEVRHILNRMDVSILQNMNELLVKTFEKNSKDFLWQANNRGEITYASSQLQQLIKAQNGFEGVAEPNMLLNKNNQFGAMIKNYIHSEENFEMFFAKLEYEGRMEYWAVTGDPVYDDNFKQIGFSGFGTNMTAVKKAERRKNQVETYQSITRMASVIGNDFRTHLQTIVEYLDTPPIAADLGEMDKEQKNIAFQAAQEALGMTTQLFDMGDQDNGAMERIIIYQFLDKLFDELQVEYSFGVKFIPNISCSTFVCADERQLSRCIRNVIENSIVAMGGKGEIFIEVETLKANSIEIERFMSDKPGKTNIDYAYISIRDTGPGIPATEIDNIFKPFVTTKVETGSRGLGLSMVENFCLQLQGFAVATNTHNGAIVEIVLPQESAENTSAELGSIHKTNS